MANSKSGTHTEEVKRPAKALGMYLPKILPADGKPDPFKKLNPFTPLPPINQRSRSWDPPGSPSSTDKGSEGERHGRLGSIGSHVGLQGVRHSRRGDHIEREQGSGFDLRKPKVKHLSVTVSCGMDEGRDGERDYDDRLDSTSRWVNGQGLILQEGHRRKRGSEDGGERGCCDSAAGEMVVEGASSLPGNGFVRDGGDGCDVGDVSCNVEGDDDASYSVSAYASFSKEERHTSLASGKSRRLFTGITKTSRAYFAQNMN